MRLLVHSHSAHLFGAFFQYQGGEGAISKFVAVATLPQEEVTQGR